MNDKFNASISLEKFSAFLDGNLSDSERLAVSKEIAKDEFLSSMVDANAETDEMIAFDSDRDGENYLMDENSFELPSLDCYHDSVENFDLSDIWMGNNSSLSINERFENRLYMGTAMNESFHNSSSVEQNVDSSDHIMKAKVNYGYEPNHEESTFDLNIYQGNQPSCAIRSQEIIMRDYGVSISQEELIEFAMKNGWYDSDPEKGGTPRNATGNLLDAVGIETKRYDDASIFDIISELRAGHRVIVSVDANELWVKKEPKLLKRLFGEFNNKINDTLNELTGVQGANHALIVGGVNVNPDNPSDIKVVLIDSGSGDVCIEYGFKDFKKAWDDSHHHMVATTEPAPFQYNYHTHEMEPSSFQTDFKPSMVALPTGISNQFKLSESYYDKYDEVEYAFNSSNNMIPFDDENSITDGYGPVLRNSEKSQSDNQNENEDDYYSNDNSGNSYFGEDKYDQGAEAGSSFGDDGTDVMDDTDGDDSYGTSNYVDYDSDGLDNY